MSNRHCPMCRDFMRKTDGFICHRCASICFWHIATAAFAWVIGLATGAIIFG